MCIKVHTSVECMNIISKYIGVESIDVLVVHNQQYLPKLECCLNAYAYCYQEVQHTITYILPSRVLYNSTNINCYA